MAKNNSLLNISGTVAGLTFFSRNGKAFVRKLSSLVGDRIKSDPSFVRTRENMQEFSGAALISKAIRTSLVQEFKDMTDPGIVGRMVKLTKEIMNRGAGKRGQRPFEPLPNASLLVNFGFSRKVNFDSVFLAPYSSVVNASRTEVKLNIPSFNASNFVNAPAGATHFRIIQVIGALSSYKYDFDAKKYLPTDEAANGLSDYDASDYFAVSGETGADIEITVALDAAVSLAATTALISCIGIEFYQKSGTEYYLLATNNALKVQAVY